MHAPAGLLADPGVLPSHRLHGGLYHHRAGADADRSRISSAKAASVGAVFGIGVVLGRLSVGWLVDHFFAPYVMIGSMLCPVIGLVMYATGDASGTVFLWAALIAPGVGSENDLLGFSIARYLGRKSYGKLYGIYLQLPAWRGSDGGGPWRLAHRLWKLFARDPLVIAGEIVLVMLLSSRMGPYVFRVPRRL